jgi:hypothetical protein
MGLERRGNNLYYYHKYREDGRVVSEYVGGGELGELWIAFYVLAKAYKEINRKAWQQERAEMKALDQTISEVQEPILTLTRAWLLAAGYHTHKGQWRKRRKNEPETNHKNGGGREPESSQ